MHEFLYIVTNITRQTDAKNHLIIALVATDKGQA